MNPVTESDVLYCKQCGAKLPHTNRHSAFCSRACRRTYRMTVRSKDGGTPSSPTMWLPGTTKKLEILRARVEAGEDCFHPHDAGWDGLYEDYAQDARNG